MITALFITETFCVDLMKSLLKFFNPTLHRRVVHGVSIYVINTLHLYFRFRKLLEFVQDGSE